MSTANRSRLRGRSSGTNTVTGTRTWSRRREASGLAALVALCACGAAAGSDDVEERIARCAAATAPGARIACLERNLRELAGAPSTPAEPMAGAGETPPSAPPEEPVPAASTPQAPAPGPVETPAPTEEEPVSARQAPRAAGPAPAAAERAAPDPAAELGAEQVRARTGANEEEESRVRARAVEFRFVGYERLLVRLDNGQVWRQIDGDRESVVRGLRDVDTFEVEMWGTKLGGYRMRILPLGRTIRVERLR